MRCFQTCFFCFLLYASAAQPLSGPRGETFYRRIIASGLSDPWEILYGPDQYLWVTESKAYQVSRINPRNGRKTLLLNLTAERQFPRYDLLKKSGKPWPQGGLMGMALHPDLLNGQPYVYLAYHYWFAGTADSSKGCKENHGGCFFRIRVVRYEYDMARQQLKRPVVLCDTLPGSNDHNGGRLLIAPVGNQSFLFYTAGDMGAGQFNNAGRPNHAQQTDVYEGKILRFNLVPDNDTDTSDRWIPDDNPFNTTRQNAVFSYGHRNGQGLAYAVVNGKGLLYESEHGPYSDDEVNLIEKGRNYGHPLILGFADGNYDGLAAGVTAHSDLPGEWHTTYPLIRSEKENARSLGASYRDPVFSLYPYAADSLAALYREARNNNDKPEWPSEAPGSLAVYTAAAIPGWKNTLLLPSLKHGHLVRLQLNAAGNGITGDTLQYFQAPVRYRDIALSPDGTRIYLSTDSAAVTSGPSKEDPKQVALRGCIIEFRYLPGSRKKEMRRGSGKTKPMGVAQPMAAGSLFVKPRHR